MISSYQDILNRIEMAKLQSNRSDEVVLIAVSKKKSSEAIRELYLQGQRDFGENYVQELVQKASELSDLKDIRWHFIGHLQTNKVKSLIAKTPGLYAVHSLDSLKLANELDRRWAETKSPPLSVFIELNIAQESNKTGILENEIPVLLEQLKSLKHLNLIGFMTIPATKNTTEGFKKLLELRQTHLPQLKGLSMGMSQDFEAAIRSGATHVRIGTALFGER